MSIAKELYCTILGVPDHEDADMRLAVQQTRDMRDRYKAPHAHRSASIKKPPRRPSGVLAPRLFTGHRP